jgi:hypothetical protein
MTSPRVSAAAVRHVIIDAEGRPDLVLSTMAQEGLCAWCFNLLAADEGDITKLPLSRRPRIQDFAIPRRLPTRWRC